jgi:hypothetical protein
MRRQTSFVARFAAKNTASTAREPTQSEVPNPQVSVIETPQFDDISTVESSNACYLTPATTTTTISPSSSPSPQPKQTGNGMATNRSQTVSQNQQRERRIFITLSYVLFSYLICWFPFYIAFDTYAWKPDLVPAGLYSFFFWSTYVNSTLNPFIYAFTNTEFRLAFIKVVKRICGCSKQKNTT